MDKEELFRLLAEHRAGAGGLESEASVEISISGDDFVVVVAEGRTERVARGETHGQQVDSGGADARFIDALVEAGQRLPLKHEIEFIPGSQRGRLTVSVDGTKRQLFFYADEGQRQMSDFPKGRKIDVLMQAIADLHRAAAPDSEREHLHSSGEPGIRTRE